MNNFLKNIATCGLEQICCMIRQDKKYKVTKPVNRNNFLESLFTSVGTPFVRSNTSICAELYTAYKYIAHTGCGKVFKKLYFLNHSAII